MRRLDNELVKLQRAKLTCRILLSIAIGILFLSFYLAWIAVVFLSFAFVFVMILIIRFLDKKIKSEIGAPLIENALKTVFDDVRYSMQERLPDSMLELYEMDFPFDIDSVSGSDRVSATYKGLQIDFSDIELIDIRHSGRTRRVTVFQGIWLICDFGKPLSADLLVQERNIPASGWFRDNVIETESAAFNEKFLVRSSSGHDAFYILTPHMMERIMSADSKAQGNTYLRFTKNGKLHVALDSREDFFEMQGGTDAEILRKRFLSEIRYITDIIDELRLTES